MLSYSIKIQYPGTFLDLLDEKTAFDVYMLISTMEGQLNDAALVLSSYKREKSKFIKEIQAQSEALIKEFIAIQDSLIFMPIISFMLWPFLAIA